MFFDGPKFMTLLTLYNLPPCQKAIVAINIRTAPRSSLNDSEICFLFDSGVQECSISSNTFLGLTTVYYSVTTFLPSNKFLSQPTKILLQIKIIWHICNIVCSITLIMAFIYIRREQKFNSLPKR